MEEIINTVLKQNTHLFGTNPNNETSFQKEIDFYEGNKENDLIPKLYYANTEKNDVPYFYEIIEKN